MAGVRDLTKITEHIVPELYENNSTWKEFINALFSADYQILNNNLGKAPCLWTIPLGSPMRDCPKREIPIYELKDIPLQHKGGSLYNLMAACASRGFRLSSDNDVQFAWNLDRGTLESNNQFTVDSDKFFVNTGLSFSAMPYAGWDSKTHILDRVFNQLIKNGNFNTEEDIWSNIAAESGSHIIMDGKMYFNGTISTDIPTIATHRYYLSFEVFGGTEDGAALFGPNTVHTLSGRDRSKWVRYSFADMYASSDTTFLQFSLMPDSYIRNIWVVDLTHWGDDTIADTSTFEAIYPARYYDYLPISADAFGSPETQKVQFAFFNAMGDEIDGRIDILGLRDGVAQIESLSDFNTALSEAFSVKLLCSLPMDKLTWYLKFSTEDTLSLGSDSIPFYDECIASMLRIAPGTETRSVTFDMVGSWNNVPSSFTRAVGESWSISFNTTESLSQVSVSMGGVDVSESHLTSSVVGNRTTYTITFDEGQFVGNVLIQGITGVKKHSVIVEGTNIQPIASQFVSDGGSLHIVINAASDAFIRKEDVYTSPLLTPTAVTITQNGDSCVIVDASSISAGFTIYATAYMYHTIRVKGYSQDSSITQYSPRLIQTTIAREGEPSTVLYDADFASNVENVGIYDVVVYGDNDIITEEAMPYGTQHWSKPIYINADASFLKFVFTTGPLSFTITTSYQDGSAGTFLVESISNTATSWACINDYTNVITYKNMLWLSRWDLRIFIDNVDVTDNLPSGAERTILYGQYSIRIFIPKESVRSSLELRYVAR